MIKEGSQILNKSTGEICIILDLNYDVSGLGRFILCQSTSKFYGGNHSFMYILRSSDLFNIYYYIS